MSNRLKENRKRAKEKNIKIWTWKEIIEEYERTGIDCNYIPLELVGSRSYFFISPTYDGKFVSPNDEFVCVSDLKVYPIKE